MLRPIVNIETLATVTEPITIILTAWNFEKEIRERFLKFFEKRGHAIIPSAFFFRKKKVVIDAFTHMRTAYEYFPIDYAIKFVPEWWKSLPKEYTKTTNLGLNLNISTLKRCNGFLDLYARGFVLPMWSDLVMNTQETGGYQFQWANSNSAVTGDTEVAQPAAPDRRAVTHPFQG